MSERSIIVIGGDAATAIEGIPIVNNLRQRGHDVRWIMDGTGEGCKILDKQKVAYEKHRRELLMDSVSFVLVLTSATATAAQIAWTNYCNVNHLPVGWYEDFPGTANVREVRDLEPTLLMVIAKEAELIARHVRPLVPVHVVGKPSLETRAEVIREATHKHTEARDLLKVNKSDFMVVYWSGGESIDRAEHQLTVLRDISPVRIRMLLAPRIHPKLDRLGVGTQDRLIKYACSGRAETLDWHNEDADVVNTAADVVVADAGCTEGMVSVLMGTPTIITRFPDDYTRLSSRGLPGGVPMLITCGAAFSAESGNQLVYLLRMFAEQWQREDAWEGLLDLCQEQAIHLQTLLEPGAAERIAGIIEATG